MSNRWTRAAEKLLPVFRNAMQTYGKDNPGEAVMAKGIFPTLSYSGQLVPYKTIIRWTDGYLYIAQYDTYDRQDTDPAHDTNGWFKLDYIDGYRVIPASMTTATLFSKDECGWWNGVLYRSKIDNNSWTPDGYAAGWEEIAYEH